MRYDDLIASANTHPLDNNDVKLFLDLSDEELTTIAGSQQSSQTLLFRLCKTDLKESTKRAFNAKVTAFVEKRAPLFSPEEARAITLVLIHDSSTTIAKNMVSIFETIPNLKSEMPHKNTVSKYIGAWGEVAEVEWVARQQNCINKGLASQYDLSRRRQHRLLKALAATEQLRQDAHKKADDLSKQVADLTDSVTNEKSIARTAEASRQQDQERIIALTVQVERLQKEMNAPKSPVYLQSSYDHLKTSHDKMKAKHDQVLGLYQDATKDADELRNTVEQLEKEISKLNDELHTQRQKPSIEQPGKPASFNDLALEYRITGLENSIKSKEHEKESALLHLKSVQQQLELKELQLVELQSEMEQLRLRNAELEKRSESQEEVQSLTTKLNERDEEITELKRLLDNAKVQMEKMEAKVERLKVNAASQKKDADAVKRQLAAIPELVAKASKANAELEEAVEQLPGKWKIAPLACNGEEPIEIAPSRPASVAPSPDKPKTPRVLASHSPVPMAARTTPPRSSFFQPADSVVKLPRVPRRIEIITDPNITPTKTAPTTPKAATPKAGLRPKSRNGSTTPTTGKRSGEPLDGRPPKSPRTRLDQHSPHSPRI